jgi:hypothetical protein
MTHTRKVGVWTRGDDGDSESRVFRGCLSDDGRGGIAVEPAPEPNLEENRQELESTVNAMRGNMSVARFLATLPHRLRDQQGHAAFVDEPGTAGRGRAEAVQIAEDLDREKEAARKAAAGQQPPPA